MKKSKKIICTIGPASLNKQTLNLLKDRGVDYFRINLSHTPLGEIEEKILELKKFDVPIIIDTEGSQVRTGNTYDIFLKEVRRVLKPDGRFIGSVPNLWCDETGKDPNPFHYHVFDWEKLKAAIEKYFIVEERWSQTAGGGYKLWDKQRAMQMIPLGVTQAVETEWWIISACVDPRSIEKTSYTNPFHRDDNHIPVCVDFAKYYDNPWLYRTIVQLGERLSNREALTALCLDIANTARDGSADQGAALCVLAYQLLESLGFVIAFCRRAIVIIFW